MLNFSRWQVDQPVVGIMTMHVYNEKMRTENFNYHHFSWEHNVNFVHYAGSFAVPIRYDISDEDLYPLLDSINGVFLTGGGLDIMYPNGTHSEYYKTAKKIFKYSIMQKDKYNITWPVFGIC
jgi:gamma-glutamyl-gamma-aminobutyrate hydrolase PuuD